MKKIIIIVFLTFLLQTNANSQKADTIYIEPKHINTSSIKSGVHQWMFYNQANTTAPRKNTGFISYDISFIDHKGKKAIALRQMTEASDTVYENAYAICDANSFKPLYFEYWNKALKKWKKFDFIERKAYIDGKEISRTDTASSSKKLLNAIDSVVASFTLNWHIDLITFPIFPYKKNRSFLIDFYQPGSTGIAKKNLYKVIGSKLLKGYNQQQIDCWLLERKSNYGSQIFWISKKTREMLKLEEEFMGRFHYKIKLGFSND